MSSAPRPAQPIANQTGREAYLTGIKQLERKANRPSLVSTLGMRGNLRTLPPPYAFIGTSAHVCVIF